MLNFGQSIFLGAVQGLTEFIPVSSSGHLIIARSVFNISDANGLSVDAVLQLASALTLLFYFRKDFVALLKYISGCFKTSQTQADISTMGVSPKTLLAILVLGSLVPAIAGVFLESTMETVFRNSEFVVVTLVLGSILFWTAEAHAAFDKPLTAKRGIFVGIFQTLALLPGMSRAGATISGGLLLGLTRETAAKISFFLGFPLLFGSGLKKLLELWQTGILSAIGVELLLGAVVSFLVGLAAIHWMISFLKNHKLNAFAWYRVILAVLIIAFAV
ncbi:MAG: undecaprenyl-diphosphate phosphatase [bacterium]|nr:undecaprenyl-diphosphate phosphatase [bacterium]